MRSSSRAARSAYAKPRVLPPTSPPEPQEGIPGPTFLASDGHVWRRSMQGWDTVDEPHAGRLLTGLQADAANTADWFHPMAARLAGELELAINEARKVPA